MEKRIGKLWTYDKALNLRQNDLERAIASETKVCSRIEEDEECRIAFNRLKNSNDIEEKASFAELAAKIERIRKHSAQNTDVSKLSLSILRKARPILIGPATLDMLLYEQPESYEYIKEGHLPFNNMFFEFLEPVSLGMPFLQQSRKIVGIHFYLSSILNSTFTDEQRYISEMYYEDNEKLRSLIMTCNPVTMAEFQGSTKFVRFLIDMGSGIVRYSRDEDIVEEVKKGNMKALNAYLCSKPLDELENKDFFITMANLCTNFINYINAENKEVIEYKRNVMIKSNNNGNSRKTAVRQEPYSVIKIKPYINHTYERDESAGKSWELKERIYVRGHNRRLRDENGGIRKIIRIDPCVKGPPDAPWKEQRYEVLYRQLQRERQMLDRGQRFG